MKILNTKTTKVFDRLVKFAYWEQNNRAGKRLPTITNNYYFGDTELKVKVFDEATAETHEKEIDFMYFMYHNCVKFWRLNFNDGKGVHGSWYSIFKHTKMTQAISTKMLKSYLNIKNFDTYLTRIFGNSFHLSIYPGKSSLDTPGVFAQQFKICKPLYFAILF